MLQSKLLFCLIICSSLSFRIEAQQQSKISNIWYFGNKAGVSFNALPPFNLQDGELVSNEGSASISDQDGNLLFYTDGVTVWNRAHQIMPNGFNLEGSQSSTQSALILPVPESNTLYYLFTVGFQSGKLSYSVIDISLDNGLGDVLPNEKNIELRRLSAEKISAVLHQDQSSYWIVTHAWDSDAFLAYQLTAQGLNRIPVTSNIGSVHTGGVTENQPHLNSLGYMKLSPNGERLALAVTYDGFVEVFDFDNSTGIVSNPARMDYPDLNPYGIEFSADSKLLYVSAYPKEDIRGEGRIFQYELTQNIKATEVVINTPSFFTVGALQLGTDYKIYVARAGISLLSRINNPNLKGAAAQFEDVGIGLGQGVSQFGLPNVIQSIFFVNTNFSYENDCFTQQTAFKAENEQAFDSFYWDFGDSGTSEENFSEEPNPLHTFSEPGTYLVKLTLTINGVIFTEEKEVIIHPLPTVNLGNDTTLLYQEILPLDVRVEGATYLWQDGSTEPTFTVTDAGTYWVEVSNEAGCTTRDEIVVSYEHPLNFDLGENLSLCEGESVLLDATVQGATYLWQDGSTTPSFEVTGAGIFWVDVTDAYGQQTIRDSITVEYTKLSSPVVNDFSVCDPELFTLNVETPDASLLYQWYTDAGLQDALGEGSSISASLSGNSQTFYVTASRGECHSEASSLTVQLEELSLTISPDQTIQEGESVQLQADGATSYLWSPIEGLDNPTIANPIASPVSTTTYSLTAQSALGCEATAQVTITVLPTEDTTKVPVDTTDINPPGETELLKIPNVFTPNDDGINDVWEIIHLDQYPISVLKVYSRWGVEVFSATGVHEPWDGTFQGNRLPADVYFYVLELNNPQENVRSGSVTLIR